MCSFFRWCALVKCLGVKVSAFRVFGQFPTQLRGVFVFRGYPYFWWSSVFWTGENVPSERVRSKPADIGQLLLQCRRRCSRVIVSLTPNHTLSLARAVATICVSSEGNSNPRPRQGLIAALASAIIRKDRYVKKRKRQQPTTTICSNIYTTIRAAS